jgi:hypothetical protein
VSDSGDGPDPARPGDPDADTRNVVDRYKGWPHEDIVADLDARRHPFHVAIENWQHDLNIGAVVRNANAFLAAAVHIVGRRRWNRRGAMVTDRYQHLHHHPDVAALHAWARERDLPLLGVDNLPGSRPIDAFALPEEQDAVLGPVRLDALDQRSRRQRRGDARVDPPPRGGRGRRPMSSTPAGGLIDRDTVHHDERSVSRCSRSSRPDCARATRRAGGPTS